MKTLPYGSVLSVCDIGPKNSYGWGLNLKNGSLLSWFLGIFGVPHLGARIRNRLVAGILEKNGKGKTIIDVGGGIGLSGFYFSQFGYKYVGIEISKDKINIGRKMAGSRKIKNVEFVLANVFNNYHSKTKANYVLCMEVLEHVKDPTEILRIIYSLLKKDGRAVITFPSSHWINGLSKKYLHHIVVGYELDDIEKFIEKLDFKISRINTFGNGFIGDLCFLIDFFLIKYFPLLAGVFFWFFYPLVILDTKFTRSLKPLGYVMVLQKI